MDFYIASIFQQFKKIIYQIFLECRFLEDLQDKHMNEQIVNTSSFCQNKTITGNGYMEKLLQQMKYIENVRQEEKVKHKLKDILVIVLFATLADTDDWVEFAEVYEDYLKKYIGLENGVPSHGLMVQYRG